MYSTLKGLIGNTPMYILKLRYKGNEHSIYIKAEHYNFTGSIKDRMAYYIISNAIKNGKIGEGMHIVEATSGNTGIAFAGIGASLGMKVSILMPDWMSEERKKIIESFGAEIKLISKEEGGFLGSISQAEEMCKGDSCFLPRQFENSMNPLAHYYSTGPEILEQMGKIGLTPAAFIAGVGTGGTIIGTGKFLKEKVPGIKLYPLEPENSPTLRTGKKIGKHRIQGISDDFIPSIVDFSILDEIIDAHDGDAIRMAQMLAKNGIGVGISSGANLIGAIKVAEKLGKDKSVVTVFSDDNKKYLSTDLTREEPILEHFITNDVELLELKAVPSTIELPF